MGGAAGPSIGLRLNILQEKLEGLRQAFGVVEAESKNLPALERLLLSLEEVVRCPVCQRAYRSSDWSFAREELIDELQNEALKAFSYLEKSYASRLEGAASQVKRYLGEISSFTREEFEAARIDKDSKVLFIGCGSVPVSAVTIALESGCFVTAVDSDPEACALAEQTISKLGLADQIEVLQMDGRFLTVGDHSHAVIASLTCCKGEVVENLGRSAVYGFKALLRYGNGLARIMNTELSDTPVYPWRVVDWIHRPNHIYDTLLLRYERVRRL